MTIQIGDVFDRLTVTLKTDRKCAYVYYYLCTCICGNTKETLANNLKSGATRSCGCYHKERINETKITHGCSRNKKSAASPEYTAWSHLKSRCQRPKDSRYQNYGARGITVCDRWLDFNNFLEDMGEKPSNKHQIDRIDNNGNYEPSNCRWVTTKENCRNRTTNLSVTYQDKTKILVEWLDELGINYSCYHYRLKRGFTTLQALGLEPTDKPTRSRQPNKPKPIDSIAAQTVNSTEFAHNESNGFQPPIKIDIGCG